MKVAPPDAELRRAKDYFKGSLMLSLESTSSRMSNLARQEMFFGRQFTLDPTIEPELAIEIHLLPRQVGHPARRALQARARPL